MVDFHKASNVNKEWKAMGKQIVALAAESYRPVDTGGIKCLHCGLCSTSDKDVKPLFLIHHDDCEVGKAEELISKIRKRVKADKT